MENIIIIALLASLFFLVYILFKEIKKQKRFKAKYKLDNSLNKRLLTMLDGDEKAALRLLTHRSLIFFAVSKIELTLYIV